MSANTETAVIAGGCFWPAQELLRQRNGVISTRVGYTGGENDNPTADDHPGHAEAIEVVFDPEQTSYRAILEFFFQIHRADLGEARVFWEAEDQHYLHHYPDTKNQSRPSPSSGSSLGGVPVR